MNAILVVLANGLWQGAAIAALTWVALRLFPRTNAATRYAAWTVALLATLVIPILTTIVHTETQESASPSPVAQSHIASQHTALAAASQKTAAENPSRSELKDETASVATGFRSGFSRPHFNLDVPLYITAAIFGLWGLASLALVVRLAVALLRLERLKQDALPLGIEFRDQMVQWQRLSSQDRDVRICVTDGIEVPVAVGLFDAMVLLPGHLLPELDPSEVDQISLHELAHLLRHDDWTNGFQRVVTALLFFNPAVWFIARQMDIEREVACDDYVLVLTGAVRNYAYCLTKMAERTAWPHQPLAAPGVFTTRKNISIRIERLLRTGRAIGSSISPATAIAVALGLFGGYVLARLVTPQVAFAMPEPPLIAQLPSAPLAVTMAPLPTTRPLVVSVPSIPPVHVTLTVPAQKFNAAAMEQITSAAKVIAQTIPSIPPSRVHRHERDVAQAGINCSGCDFEHQNLANKSFAGANLAGSNFESANLQGTNFNGANLSSVNFEGADLRNASFVGANLSGANFDGARLDGARLDGANLNGTDIDLHKLSEAQLRSYLPGCHGCNLEGVNLSGMDLHNISLVGSNLENANLGGANLSKANLGGANLEDADLRNAVLTGAILVGANFDGVKLDGANLDGANLSGVSLDPRKLSQAQIHAYLPHCHGCDLEGANLSGMDLSGMKIIGVNLRNANLRGANLSNATFSGVDFSGADLRGARTDGTKFIGCEFSGAQLGNP